MYFSTKKPRARAVRERLISSPLSKLTTLRRRNRNFRQHTKTKYVDIVPKNRV
jgi:hypothetical protein